MVSDIKLLKLDIDIDFIVVGRGLRTPTLLYIVIFL